MSKNNTRKFDLTDGGGKKAYIAKIIGLDSKWGFAREFCFGRGEQERGNRHRIFELDRNTQGVCEYRTYTAGGNKYGDFFRFVEGRFTILTEVQVKELFGFEPRAESVRKEGFHYKGEFYQESDGGWWFVTYQDGFYTEDGLSFGLAQDNGYVEGDYHKARPATKSEAAEQDRLKAEREAAEQAETERKTQRRKAWSGLRAAVEEIKQGDSERPPAVEQINGEQIEYTASFMNSLGHRLVIQDGQAIWLLRYNGRSGDDWSYNNYGNWIANRYAWQPEFAEIAERVRKFEVLKGGK